jgi:hypothetical protein
VIICVALIRALHHTVILNEVKDLTKASESHKVDLGDQPDCGRSLATARDDALSSPAVKSRARE